MINTGLFFWLAFGCWVADLWRNLLAQAKGFWEFLFPESPTLLNQGIYLESYLGERGGGFWVSWRAWSVGFWEKGNHCCGLGRVKEFRHWENRLVRRIWRVGQEG